jgi:hypothetical protein
MAGALTAAIAAAFAGSAAAATDPYFEYTTLLLPGSGTNGAQNNTFLDGSTNNFTITRNGNTTQGTFSPFSQTGWGGYASATGQYLTAATSTAFDPGSSNFTVEAWIYPTALNTYNFIYTRDGATNAASQIAFGISSTGVLTGEVYVSSTAYTASSSAGAIVTNRWTHVAFVRNGTTTYLYVDGVQNGTNTGLSTSSINTVSIAANILNQAGAANRGMQGYCSNFRLVIGVAVYTGAFTPPTSPLAATQSSGTNISAITGTQTKILTFQSNRFIDNSVANSGAGWTLTVNGSLSVRAFSPFNPTESWSAATYGGSGYFDGSGDYLSVADNDAFALGSNDWTIECWVYVSSLSSQGFVAQVASNGADASIGFVLGINASGYPYIASYINGAYTAATASTAIVVNQWNHIAGSRASGTMGVFLNGSRLASTAVSGSSVNSTATVTVGASNSGSSALTTGYIANARIVNGTAVYSGTTYTVPTAPLTAITNTSLLLNFTNAGIYDATSKNDLETVGNAQISTAQYKFPPSSMAFDGTGDYLVTDNSDNILGFGTGDWTIEFWLRLNSTGTQVIFDGRRSSSGDVTPLIYYLSGLKYYTAGGDRISGSTLSTGVWYYIAIVKSSGSTKMYIDGSQTGSTYTDGNNYTQQSQRPIIGAEGFSVGSNPLNGYIQDLRITKGYARTITTPTAAFPTL